MAAIYDGDGMTISDGLEDGSRSDQALSAAREAAAERGEDVLLVDYDGSWLVHPDGTCDEYAADEDDE